MIDYKDVLNKNYYFLDFESNKKEEMFLLGVEIEQNFTCYVINEYLSPICENENYKEKFNIQYGKPKDIVSKLLSSMSEDNDVIVAYSTPELKLIQKTIPKGNLPNILYLNLAKAAKTWVNKYHKEEFENLSKFRSYSNSFIAKKRSLASIMRLLPQSPQASNLYGPGKTTTRINYVINALKKFKKFSELSTRQKIKTTNFLNHNFYDVTCMRYLLEEIIKRDPKLLQKGIYKLTDVKS
jgi:hypothetical protein